MKVKIASLLAALFCFAATPGFAGDITDPATGLSFPETVSFAYEGNTYKLAATGVATRKKLVIKVYSVAHYLQEGATGGSKIERIMNDKYAKELTIAWAREVTAAQIQGGYKDSLEATIPQSEKAALQADVDKFIAFFNQPAKKGDRYSLRWIPGGHIEKVVDGKVVGSIQNLALAKALWSIWFGDKSVVDKDKLTANLK